MSELAPIDLSEIERDLMSLEVDEFAVWILEDGDVIDSNHPVREPLRRLREKHHRRFRLVQEGNKVAVWRYA